MSERIQNFAIIQLRESQKDRKRDDQDYFQMKYLSRRQDHHRPSERIDHRRKIMNDQRT